MGAKLGRTVQSLSGLTLPPFSKSCSKKCCCKLSIAELQNVLGMHPRESLVHVVGFPARWLTTLAKSMEISTVTHNCSQSTVKPRCTCNKFNIFQCPDCDSLRNCLVASKTQLDLPEWRDLLQSWAANSKLPTGICRTKKSSAHGLHSTRKTTTQ